MQWRLSMSLLGCIRKTKLISIHWIFFFFVASRVHFKLKLLLRMHWQNPFLQHKKLFEQQWKKHSFYNDFSVKKHSSLKSLSSAPAIDFFFLRFVSFAQNSMVLPFPCPKEIAKQKLFSCRACAHIKNHFYLWQSLRCNSEDIFRGSRFLSLFLPHSFSLSFCLFLSLFFSFSETLSHSLSNSFFVFPPLFLSLFLLSNLGQRGLVNATIIKWHVCQFNGFKEIPVLRSVEKYCLE